MPRIPATTDTEPYDEFGMLQENAEEIGLSWDGGPSVTRREIEVDADQFVSSLVWGDAEPELVFLHGGGQNAHTWDTVVLALGRPAIAIDLPGHGRSDRRDGPQLRTVAQRRRGRGRDGTARAERERRRGHVARRCHDHPACGDPARPRRAAPSSSTSPRR